MRSLATLVALLLVTACSSDPAGGGGALQGGSEPTAGAPVNGGGGGSDEGTGGAAPALCNSGLVYTGADFACMSESCCDAANDCTVNGTDVVGCLDCLIEGGERCQLLGECHNTLCVPVDGLCGTTLVIGADERVNACAEDSCCDEITSCMAEPDECAACLDVGGGEVCDAVVACVVANCFEKESQICDSGLTYGDAAVDQCLSDGCCAEYSACTAAGAEIEGCLDCLNGGGGPLCDDAIACTDESGCL